MDFLLPIWNPFIVHPLEQGLRLLATPLEGMVGPGLAGGLAIILFTILLRLVLVPLSLVQIRSQRAQMAVAPELKALQRKFKGDREGMARAQMQLYKERGVNPLAGCVPLLIQMPILFGMYAAMNQLATTGLTLDQVTQNQIEPGQVVYAAERRQEPLPYNQFVLAELHSVATGDGPFTVQIDQGQSQVWSRGTPVLNAVEPLTLTPGQAFGNPNPPNSPNGSASIFLRAGIRLPDGTLNRNAPMTLGEPFILEVWVNAASTHADAAKAVVTYEPTRLDVSQLETPQLVDVAFKSRFLWLPSLGEPDVFHLGIPGVPGIPGLLLIVMTITSFFSQRMTTMPTEDPQQQAMMRSMAFMPLMYLFFFLGTPAGLVLYWLASNVFSMFQQYFTVGLGLLGGDLQRITGRDLQPPWAHLPSFVPSASGAAAGDAREPDRPTSRNGWTDGVGKVDDTKPALGERRTAGAARRPRPGQGKGRKRGKR